MQIELLEIDFNSEEAIYTWNRHIQTAGRRYPPVSKTDGRMYRN